MLTRRDFLAASSAAAATQLFGAPTTSKTPDSALEKLAAVALREAKKNKASYCDIRIVRLRDQRIGLRLTPERSTGKTMAVPNVLEDSSFGFGVRVIVNGAWGFASSPLVTPEEIARITGEATIIAKANAAIQPKPVQLAPVKAYRDVWVTPHDKNPLDVPMAEKLDLLRRVTEEVKKNQRVFGASASLNLRSEDKYFASSEGSSIQQLILQIYGNIDANAVDRQNGVSRNRSYVPTQASAGWEYVPEMNLEENAQRIREEVLEHLTAPAVRPGKKDLILMPNHLMLTIHESVAHPTELDRALGYEANYAGTSYITLDKRGKRIASEHCTFVGDRTSPRALATCGYDDDGVKTTEFVIIEKGIFRNYQTTREQAHLVGDKESHGCCQADSWATVPFQRMPNVHLRPGPKETTLEDLIGGIEDGVLIDGRGSYSIDQQRYNFQFGGDAFWEIKGGKKRGMISRVSYQARTPDFWQACDGVAGPAYWKQCGTTGDAKGEPTQINSISHGCSPSRFRKVDVILTD
ncbi:MAG TPA: TldD/PmbA family protein [Bryobacteraceae bacterium]|jgi:TldD protein|nr:TldD/PmbA family protein [Bryobacteraceae bacterium]